MSYMNKSIINENQPKQKKTFSVDLIPTLNRSIILSAFILGKPFTFAVMYDKKSPALQFQIDSNDSNIKNGNLKIQMCRNLDTSMFCKTFLHLESVKNEKSDYHSKYIGLRNIYSKQVIQFISEQYDFQLNEKNKSPQNYLMVLGWKIQDIDNDLLFYYIQRKFYNDITRMNVVRTAGLQLATARGLELLNRYNYDYENSVRKIDKNDLNELPEFLSSSKNNINDIDSKIFDEQGI